MSKLTKLLRDPKLFVEDAVTNLRSWTGLSALLTSATGGDLGPVASDVRPGQIRAALLRALSGPRGVFTSPSTLRPDELNCLDHDLPWVAVRALLLAEAAGFQLQITARRRATKVNRRNVVSVIRRAMSATSIEVTFERDGEVEAVGIAVWERRDHEGVYYCRGNNPFAKKLPIAELERLRDPASNHVDLAALYECPIDSACTFDVDLVYTWVNHLDPGWRALIERFKKPGEIDWDRYHASDELRYSLRSIAAFAAWVRQIHIVTNCARPEWLAEHPKVRWVSHEEVFPEGRDYLPTFSSHAIESCLHRVPGLSEHFVYFNDDVFLGKPASKQDFFRSNGCSLSHLEPYGMVYGEVAPERPDYLNAAINGRRLIEDTFGVSPVQLHEHTPLSLRKSVLEELEQRFPQELDDTRRARFRSSRDLSIASFLYHHYAYQVGKAVRVPAGNSLLVRAANAEQAFEAMLNGKRRLFFCINEGGSSAFDQAFHDASNAFLRRYYPIPAPWEKPVG